MPTKPKDISLRVTEPVQGSDGQVTYFRRRNGKVWYTSGTDTPLCVSNLVRNQAVELHVALERAPDEFNCRKAIQEAWRKANPNADIRFLPKVEAF